MGGRRCFAGFAGAINQTIFCALTLSLDPETQTNSSAQNHFVLSAYAKLSIHFLLKY